MTNEEELNVEYGDLLPKWQVELIAERARRKGIRKSDLDDVLQEIVMDVLEFKYDLEKSNGATEATALTTVIDRRICNFRREVKRHRVRVARLTAVTDPAEPMLESVEALEMSLDVKLVVAGLSAADQEICKMLLQGHDIKTAACRLNLSRDGMDRSRLRIWKAFLDAGVSLRGTT